MSVMGGAAKLAKVVTSDELEENGGPYRLAGRVATPVHGFSDGDRSISGGRVQPVYIVSQSDIDDGVFSLKSGASRPMADIAVVGGANRTIAGTVAIPVYVTGGNLGANYIDTVLGLNPIAYWPLNETAGSTAVNAEGTAARNGTYAASPTLNAITGPDGVNGAVHFDGANQFLDIYSASLEAAFDKDTFSISFWMRTNWQALGSGEEIIILRSDSNNQVRIFRAGAANAIQLFYNGSGTNKSRTDSDAKDTNTWYHYVLTVDVTGADEHKAYRDGSQLGLTLTGLGSWAGSWATTRVNVAANSQVPSLTYEGYMAHVAFFDYVLTPAQVLELATI